MITNGSQQPQSKRVHRGYPTEKPVMLIEKLILQSSELGDLVVDPFFGSGSTLKAAINQGRRAAGSDIAELAHAHLNECYPNLTTL